MKKQVKEFFGAFKDMAVEAVSKTKASKVEKIVLGILLGAGICVGGLALSGAIVEATAVGLGISSGLFLGGVYKAFSSGSEVFSTGSYSLSREFGAIACTAILSAGLIAAYAKTSMELGKIRCDNKNKLEEVKHQPAKVLMIDFNSKSINNKQVEKMVKSFKEEQLKKGQMSPITRQMSPMKR